MLRIFTLVKIQRLRPGLNPRTWVPEASMLNTRPPKPSIAGVTSPPDFNRVCSEFRCNALQLQRTFRRNEAISILKWDKLKRRRKLDSDTKLESRVVQHRHRVPHKTINLFCEQ